jgi:hydroxypyruvate reductase
MVMQKRLAATEIFIAGLMAVQPGLLISQQVRRSRGDLVVGGWIMDRREIGKLIILGVGKAAGAMADAVEQELREWISGGLVVTKKGYGLPLEYLRSIEAGHPIPDQAGMKASQTFINMVTPLQEKDLLILLLSGGASALLPDSTDIPLPEVQEIFSMLLRSGADIREMNTVRKHLSSIKGGNLARLAWPARVFTFILSDVVGDPLDVIGSGPTVPDPTTYADAYSILEKYDIWTGAGDAVKNWLRSGMEGVIPETPKPGDPVFDRVENMLIGNNSMALRAAADKARQMGYHVELRQEPMQGEARTLAAELATDFLTYKGPRPACIIMGGETTVTVTGNGKGGRNQELALAILDAWMVMGIGPEKLPTVLCAGTDGTDGPTEAAGAFADDNLMAIALGMDMDPHEYLANNDSYAYLEAAGAQLFTGPTFTNVADMMVVLMEP